MPHRRHRRWTAGFVIGAGLLAAGASDAPAADADWTVFQPGESVTAEAATPWTHTDVANDPDDFQFLVVTDRTGGHRPGVFPAIMKKVNLMQPEFVMSVGDYIEGYTEDPAEIEAQWQEVAAMIDSVKAPFFHAPGNHDYGNPTMRAHWQARFGRSYYHFLYRDVLFLVLNTEDPPPANTPASDAAWDKVSELARTEGPAASAEFVLSSDVLQPFLGQMSEEQTRYALDALARHRDVRWTFVFMHKPIWDKRGENNFTRIEAALKDRDYTVFAGHYHNYLYMRRHGQDYMRLGTTGGEWVGAAHGRGNMDHITWVTMRDESPVFANIVASGIYAKDGVPDRIPGAEFCGAAVEIACQYGEVPAEGNEAASEAPRDAATE